MFIAILSFTRKIKLISFIKTDTLILISNYEKTNAQEDATSRFCLIIRAYTDHFCSHFKGHSLTFILLVTKISRDYMTLHKWLYSHITRGHFYTDVWAPCKLAVAVVLISSILLDRASNPQLGYQIDFDQIQQVTVRKYYHIFVLNDRNMEF
jgi:hypothetical protein